MCTENAVNSHACGLIIFVHSPDKSILVVSHVMDLRIEERAEEKEIGLNNGADEMPMMVMIVVVVTYLYVFRM